LDRELTGSPTGRQLAGAPAPGARAPALVTRARALVPGGRALALVAGALVPGALVAGSLALAVIASAGTAPPARAPFALGGLWDAQVTVGGNVVPFRFRIAGTASQPSGAFLNGPVRVVATGGRFNASHLVLDFDQYAKRLDVTLDDSGALTGTYGPNTPAMQARIPTLPFTATRAGSRAARSVSAMPPLAGTYLVPIPTDEKAWHLIVRQHGSEVDAVILRVDGDTGELRGIWADGRVLLSHFDGARPTLVELAPAAAGALQLVLKDLHGGADTTLTAYRASDAAARGLPAADDPRHHTRMRDPSVAFAFSFPDLAGKTVANTDARFAHHVLIVDVSGSWCPNCHDEAPFLEELYRRYHGRGLEIVSLSFEEPEQLESLARLKAFIARYGITYTVLVGGTPAEARERLPEVQRLDYWPTTFFVARDGRVRAVHTGFAAPATGEFHEALRHEFESEVETLLAE